MNTRARSKPRSLALLAIVGGGLTLVAGSSTACSDTREEAAELSSPMTAEPASLEEDEAVDLGCPEPEDSCSTEDGTLTSAEEEPYQDETMLPTSLRPRAGGTSEPKKFSVTDCIATLKAATKTTAKLCAHGIVLCAGLIGNKNGTDIQKFCHAVAKVASCGAAARDEAAKIQAQVCPYCTSIAQCADGGTKK